MRAFLRLATLVLALLLTLAGCGGEGDAPPAAGTQPVPDPFAPPPDPVAPPPDPGPPGAPQADSARPELCWQGPPGGQDCQGQLINGYMVNPAVSAIDVVMFRLVSRAYSDRLVQAHRAGKPVRLLADRSQYLMTPAHAAELDYLAAQGVPVRITRHHGLTHDKTTVLYGVGASRQGQVVLSTYHPGEPAHQWESHFSVQSAAVTRRVRERFERAWANVHDPVANPHGSFLAFRPGMSFEAQPVVTCYEDPTPDPLPVADDPVFDLCFAGDEECQTAQIIPLLDAEPNGFDMAIYSLNAAPMRDALIRLARAGRPVRLLLDHARAQGAATRETLRRIKAAGAAGNVEIKLNTASFMHMKLLVGTGWTGWTSANFTATATVRARGCTRNSYNENTAMVARHQGLRDMAKARFEALWASGHFSTFAP
jgi:phosphatidylserine/phosphatidylglycerophosphate/cardiolipin synthase-like enzyme